MNYCGAAEKRSYTLSGNDVGFGRLLEYLSGQSPDLSGKGNKQISSSGTKKSAVQWIKMF